MATTARNKYKQMLKEAEEAVAVENNLVQEATDKSENNSNYDETDILSKTSFVTIQEISDNTVSDISDLNISDLNIIDDDIEINKQFLSKKEKKPPTKITKPKTSWVWKFF